MKGIVLAGGSGTRLYPITKSISKQIIPVYDKPMIYYPIELLVGVGVKDILIITSQEHASTFIQALGDGSAFGARFTYAIQPRPEGAAQAFTIGEEFVGDEPVCLITGDCILFGKDRNVKLLKAMRAALNSGQASIFVCRDWDPNQYGVVTLDSDGKCLTIEGQTTNPLYYSITGLYVFPKGVADYAKHVGKSERGRLEVTSLNKTYFEKNKLQVQVLGSDFMWFDTNSFDSLLVINNYIKNNRFK